MLKRWEIHLSREVHLKSMVRSSNITEIRVVFRGQQLRHGKPGEGDE